jgi:mRNA interferase MazF
MSEQGDILLIPIPFTDLSSQKRRPVVVVSNNAYNQKAADIVVVAMTSNPAPADYTFTITSFDLDNGTLNHPGKVRVDKIYTLSHSIHRGQDFRTCKRKHARTNPPDSTRLDNQDPVATTRARHASRIFASRQELDAWRANNATAPITNTPPTI